MWLRKQRKDTKMASFVRLGGIAAFVAVLTFGIAMGLRLAQVPSKVLDIITLLVVTASFATAFWGTKRFFNAYSYRRADIAVSAFVGLFIVLAVFGLVENAGLGFDPDGVAGQIVDIALLTVTLVLSTLFGLQAMGFATSGGSIWRATGILYLAGSITLAFAVVAGFTALEKVSPPLEGAVRINTVICVLVLTASVIVHGVALTSGAGKMRTIAVA
jgi:hypothetical protein